GHISRKGVVGSYDFRNELIKETFSSGGRFTEPRRNRPSFMTDSIGGGLHEFRHGGFPIDPKQRTNSGSAGFRGIEKAAEHSNVLTREMATNIHRLKYGVGYIILGCQLRGQLPVKCRRFWSTSASKQKQERPRSLAPLSACIQ